MTATETDPTPTPEPEAPPLGLRATGYELTEAGVNVYIARQDRGSGTDVNPAQSPAWWNVHVQRGVGLNTIVPDQYGRDKSLIVITEARIGFDPAVPDSEMAALVAAREYAIEAAHVVAGHRQALRDVHDRTLSTVLELREKHDAVAPYEDADADAILRG